MYNTSTITIHTSNGDYTVDPHYDARYNGHKDDFHQPGDICCFCDPFYDVPLLLDFAIRANGSLFLRNWSWDVGQYHQGSAYVHTYDAPKTESAPWGVIPTPEQIDTVNGLFSGRIKAFGLKLAIGRTLQLICPIDVAAEEKKVGHTIYLA